MTCALVVHTSGSGIGSFSSSVITLVFFCPAVSCSGQGPYPVWVIEHGAQQGTWTWWMLIHDLWRLHVFAYAVPYLKCPSPLFHLVNPYSFKTPAKMSLLPLFLETSHGVFPIQSWFPLLSQPFITWLQNLSYSITLHFYETLPMKCELLEDWFLTVMACPGGHCLCQWGISCTKQADIWLGHGLAQLHGSKAGVHSALKCLMLGTQCGRLFRQTPLLLKTT